jgi:hypothetical protein
MTTILQPSEIKKPKLQPYLYNMKEFWTLKKLMKEQMLSNLPNKPGTTPPTPTQLKSLLQTLLGKTKNKSKL